MSKITETMYRSRWSLTLGFVRAAKEKLQGGGDIFYIKHNLFKWTRLFIRFCVCVLLFMVHAQIINETITNLPDNILAGQKAVTSSYYFYPFLFLWQGAFCGLLVGHICGVIRMVLDFVYPVPDCGDPDERPKVVSAIHYTYFCQMVIVITSLVIVGVSLLTKAPDRKHVRKFCESGCVLFW